MPCSSTRRGRLAALVAAFLAVAAAVFLPVQTALAQENEDDFLTPVTRVVLPPAPAPPHFALGFAELKAQLGDLMGDPIENERPPSDGGTADTIQLTTTGLAVWQHDKHVAFTDGHQTWVLQAPPAAELQIARVPSEPPIGVWDRLASCESNGRWSTNTGNGFFGGLQFLPSTWRSHGGHAYAPSANLATRGQQIAIAQRVLATQGWRAWPACSRLLGLR